VSRADPAWTQAIGPLRYKVIMQRTFRRFLVVSAVAGFLCAGAYAQIKLTVEQLVSFIRSSIQLRHDDRKVADYVKKIKLADHLDERTVEELQGMGAGPQTVAALHNLVSASNGLPAPLPPPPKPVVVPIPAPDSVEQKQILEEITQNALEYTKSLPNFICLQVTRRYIDNSGLENFRLMDTIAERLSFFEQKEDYKVVSVNGVPAVGRSHEQLGGATSSGEFGSMLGEIFAPESNTEFNWERWATLRGKRMHVYSFRVPQNTSKYSIFHQNSGRRVIAGYKGEIYADRDAKQVMRIKFEAEDLPVDFPIRSVELDLNYDYSKISGQSYLLPLKSELRSREGKYLVKNDTEFRLYNRFGADTSIQFDVPDALPEDQTKEQPAK
jgi:hypothetical protein